MDEKQCAKCKTIKPVSEFYSDRRFSDGLLRECSQCWDGRGRAWREANREKYLTQQREANRRRMAKPGAQAKKYERDYRRLKQELFDHYGRECACCGSTEDLSIDHIDGNGAEHRAMITGDPTGRKGGDKLYREIRRQGFPPGYQTLCMPCNNSKKNSPHCRIHHGDLRVDAALLMRANGWTFAAIAGALGVSRSRAYQFCNGEFAHPTAPGDP